MKFHISELETNSAAHPIGKLGTSPFPLYKLALLVPHPLLDPTPGTGAGLNASHRAPHSSVTLGRGAAWSREGVLSQ